MKNNTEGMVLFKLYCLPVVTWKQLGWLAVTTHQDWLAWTEALPKLQLVVLLKFNILFFWGGLIIFVGTLARFVRQKNIIWSCTIGRITIQM